MVLGWLKKEKKQQFNNQQFHSRLVTLEEFLYTITATVDWGGLYKLFQVLVNTSTCCTVKLSVCKHY